MSRDPNLLTTSTNRNLLQPTKANKARRESKIKKTLDKGKKRDSSSSNDQLKARAPGLSLDRHDSSSASSRKSGRSQLVDLVVEDKRAEETERVRARKEGGAEWNESGGKRFLYVHASLSPLLSSATFCGAELATNIFVSLQENLP